MYIRTIEYEPSQRKHLKFIKIRPITAMDGEGLYCGEWYTRDGAMVWTDILYVAVEFSSSFFESELMSLPVISI